MTRALLLAIVVLSGCDESAAPAPPVAGERLTIYVPTIGDVVLTRASADSN